MVVRLSSAGKLEAFTVTCCLWFNNNEIIHYLLPFVNPFLKKFFVSPGGG